MRMSDSGLSSSSLVLRLVQASPFLRTGRHPPSRPRRRRPRVFLAALLVLGPDEAALDAHGAVMVEDDEGAAPRDVVGVIGLTHRLKPLDLGFKLAETRIDFIGQFLGALMLLRQSR